MSDIRYGQVPPLVGALSLTDIIPFSRSPYGVGDLFNYATLSQYSTLFQSQLNVPTYAMGWDANANSPALASSIGVANSTYIVTKSGTTMLDGDNDWSAGDVLNFDGSTWNKVLQVPTSVELLNAPNQQFNLFTIVLPVGARYVLTGSVIGVSQTSGNVCAGTYQIVAKNVGGVVSAVGLPINNVARDDAAVNFEIRADGPAFEIQLYITSSPTDTYNWQAEYNYMKFIV